MEDKIGYDQIIEESMRNVVFRVLKKTQIEGLQSDHHFIIAFLTKAEGVQIPEDLVKRFPGEMTIILQNQFQSLKVFEDHFKVSLSFSGRLQELTIPYGAIASFSDPAVNFGLRFNVVELSDAEIEKGLDQELEEEIRVLAGQKQGQKAPEVKKKVAKSAKKPASNGKIISLDDFRKNHKKR
jgi:uncharacterized protein